MGHLHGMPLWACMLISLDIKEWEALTCEKPMWAAVFRVSPVLLVPLTAGGMEGKGNHWDTIWDRNRNKHRDVV